MHKRVLNFSRQAVIACVGFLPSVMPILALPVAHVYAAPSSPQVVTLDQLGNRVPNVKDITVSSDGKYVAFASGDGTNSSNQIIVRDITTGASTTEVLGIDDPRVFTISNNGRYLFFTSYKSLDPQYTLGTGDTHLYVKDLVTKQISLASIGPDNTSVWVGSITRIMASDDGTVVAGQCGYNPNLICKRDIVNKLSSAYPVSGSIVQLSGNGRYMFYYDQNNNLQRYDGTNGTIVAVTTACNSGNNCSIVGASADGDYVLKAGWSPTLGGPTSLSRLRISTGIEEAMSTFGVLPQISGDGTVVVSYDRIDRNVITYDFKTNITSAAAANSWGNTADQGISENLEGVYSNRVTYDGAETVFTSVSSNIGCSNTSQGACGYIAASTGPVIIGTDSVKPQVQTVDPSSITKESCAIANFTVTATDDNSGVAAGEFYVDTGSPATGPAATLVTGNNPRNGGATPMQMQAGKLVGVVGNDVPAGNYTIHIRVQDVAGNWSYDKIIPLTVTSTVSCPHLPV